MIMKFADGVAFSTEGKPHIESRWDGLYVVGDNMLIPIRDRDEGRDIIRELNQPKKKKCFYCDQPVEQDGDCACFQHLKFCCCKCGKPNADQRYSLGIYAGTYCDSCWDKSGYRKEGASAFSPLDAGESYEPI